MIATAGLKIAVLFLHVHVMHVAHVGGISFCHTALHGFKLERVHWHFIKFRCAFAAPIDAIDRHIPENLVCFRSGPIHIHFINYRGFAHAGLQPQRVGAKTGSMTDL